MAEWIYTKDRMPNDYELKWVAVHNSHYNCNDLKKAYYSTVYKIWYDVYDDELLDTTENVYAWKNYEEPPVPEYRGQTLSWNLEEGKFTYVENGYRVEKVEIAYGWRKYTAEPLKFVFNHTLYRKIKEIRK